MNFYNTHAFLIRLIWPLLAPVSRFFAPGILTHLIFYQMDDFLAISCVIYLLNSLLFLLKNDCPQFFKNRQNHSSTISPTFIFTPRSPLHPKRAWYSIKPKYGFWYDFCLWENVALPGFLKIPMWDYQIPFTNPDGAFSSTPALATIPRWDISPKKC